MLVTANRFAALLQSLGLSQVLFKPTPSGSTSARLADSINVTTAEPAGPLVPSLPETNASDSLDPSVDMLFLFVDDVDSHKSMHQRDASCQTVPYNNSDIGFQTLSPFNQTKANIFRYRQQQSVNLGSW